MQREKGEISVAWGPNCNSLRRSVMSGCYWAWPENVSVYKTSACPSLTAVPPEELRHWAVHCLCCRIWCQTTSAWKLHFSRLALTFIVQKKDYRPDSSSFHATAVPQNSMELDQHIPGTGLAQQSGSAGVSPRQLLGKKSSCREFHYVNNNNVSESLCKGFLKGKDSAVWEVQAQYEHFTWISCTEKK